MITLLFTNKLKDFEDYFHLPTQANATGLHCALTRHSICGGASGTKPGEQSYCLTEPRVCVPGKATEFGTVGTGPQAIKWCKTYPDMYITLWLRIKMNI